MIGPKPTREQKQIPAKNREAVQARSGGICEGCGEAPATNIHHRQYLARGGTHALDNLLALCGMGNTTGCHGKAHKGGESTGLSVWSWARPESCPVLLHGARWVLLFDAPDETGRWWREITAATAALLRGETT